MRRFDPLLCGALALIAVVTLRPTGGPHHWHPWPFQDVAPAFRYLWSQPALMAGEIGNILLFVPLGVLLARRGLTARRVFLLGAVLSAAIELAQLLIPGRTTSFDDVAMNALGAGLGAIAWGLVDDRRNRGYNNCRQAEGS